MKTKLEDSFIRIDVGDTGLGIAEANWGKIFVAFGMKKKGGFGLGLASAKRVVEAHGGSISFVSKVGMGTTFTVTMPVSKSG